MLILKYVFGIFVTAIFILVFSSCGGSLQRQATCVHPGVMGGTPFRLPEDAKLRFQNTTLVIPTPDGDVTLIGAACVIQWRKAGE